MYTHRYHMNVLVCVCALRLQVAEPDQSVGVLAQSLIHQDPDHTHTIPTTSTHGWSAI